MILTTNGKDIPLKMEKKHIIPFESYLKKVQNVMDVGYESYSKFIP